MVKQLAGQGGGNYLLIQVGMIHKNENVVLIFSFYIINQPVLTVHNTEFEV